MEKLTMTRRTFTKAAAVVGAAAALSASVSVSALAQDSQAATEGSAVKKIRSCCRGCGKVECGVWVYVKDGKVIRTEGDESCWNTLGNHCSKGQASIQACYHPDRIHYPMKRTTPKGSADCGWQRITWEEAYQSIADNIQSIKEKHTGLALFSWCGTGRQWCMQSDAGMALELFGSPNIIAAYQVCKGPRHFSSRLDNVQAYSWSEVINHSKRFVEWATGPEVSNYDDSGRLEVDVATEAKRDGTYISVDPRQSNLGKEASIWLNLRPGTDDALALGFCQIILDKELYDDLFIKRWSNAPFIVCPDMDPTGYTEHVQNSGNPYELRTRLLTEADIDPAMVDWTIEGDGDPKRYLVWDNINSRWTYWQAHPVVGEAHWEGETWTKQTTGFDQDLSRLREDERFPGWVADLSEFNPAIDPALYGEFDVTLKGGKIVKGRPAWDIWAEYLESFTPEKVAEITGVDADTLIEAVTTWATRDDPRIPNGGIQYGLAIEHYGKSTQTCRAIMAACAMVGAIDTPGGQRGATNGWMTQSGPTSMLPAMGAYAFMPTPQMSLQMAGNDKMPLLYWYAVWCDCNAAMECAAKETDAPYGIYGGMIGSGDHMNMANAKYNYEALKGLDFLFEANLWHSPTSSVADILLPVDHWLEMNAARITQGAAGAVGLHVRCVDPPGECKSDPLYFLELSEYFGVPAFDGPDPWNHQRITGEDTDIRALTEEYCIQGTDLPYKDWAEFAEAFQTHGWWSMKEAFPDDWGTYRRFETGQAYRKAPHQQPVVHNINIPGFPTPTMKQELWNSVIESYWPEGPDGVEVTSGFKSEALPYYKEFVHSPRVDSSYEEYPILCITGRRIPVYFHSEHRQLPWCRELWPVPRMEINPKTAREYGFEQGDWVWIESPWGKIRETVDLYYGIPENTINCEHQWWFPELAQADRGYELCCVNCIVDRKTQDKYNGSSNVRGYPVKLYKATADNSPFGDPVPCGDDGTEIISKPTDVRLKEWTIGGAGVNPDSFGEGEE